MFSSLFQGAKQFLSNVWNSGKQVVSHLADKGLSAVGGLLQKGASAVFPYLFPELHSGIQRANEYIDRPRVRAGYGSRAL